MGNKIVFIGGCWEEDKEVDIIEYSMGAVQNAANVFQKNIIDGLDRFSENGTTVLSAIFIGAYPFRYKKMCIKGGSFNHIQMGLHTDYYIPFINLLVLKHFSRIHNYKKIIKKLLKHSSNENIYFVGYSMTLSTVEALLYAKKINPKVKTCLIIPDLPEYMNLGGGKQIIKNILKGVSNKRLYSDVKKIDAYVMLTKYMTEKIDTSGKKICVVEGIASADTVIKSSKLDDDLKRIVYTGTLDEKYGIRDLVDAFVEINDKSARLVICGYGDSENYIKEKCKKDPRIDYRGTVKNEVAKSLQQDAYFLINPRNSQEEYTKYSFPSKTLEYMKSGRPVLMYKLKGIPDEYDNYIFYIEEDMKKSILQYAFQGQLLDPRSE